MVKARKYNSPKLQDLLNEITSSEMEETKNKMLIELEAKNWIKNTSQHLSIKNGFIAGATSEAAKKYWYTQFEKEKIHFAIEQLKYVKKMYPCSDQEECVNVMIKNLEQKLKEL